MLNVIFCTAPQLGERLTEYTRKIAENTFVQTTTGGIISRVLNLARLLPLHREYRDLVIVLSVLEVKDPDERQTLALQARAHFPEAYIIYITDSFDELLKLTNKNIRLSGCFMGFVPEREYASVLTSIFNEYSRRNMDARKKQGTGGDQYYTLVVGKHMQTFLLDDILYFESQNKKVRIVMRGVAVEKPLEFYESLTSIENQLKGRFLRCHSGFLINVRHIREISFKDSTVTLNGDVKVGFSQKHRKEMEDIVKAYKKKSD